MTSNAVRQELSVGELARRSGVSVSTLHFYESKGLIKSARNDGNHRRYARPMLRRVAIIRVAQKSGVPLAEIKRVFDMLPAEEPVTAANWKAMSSQWAKLLQIRIEMLAKLRDQLNSCIGCGCLSLAECPLRNPNDDLGKVGAGPRYLIT